MDFDLDDPLGDLLSDTSLDSFIGGQTNKKIVPDKKKSDLFGLIDESSSKPPTVQIEEKKPSLPRDDDWLGILSTKDAKLVKEVKEDTKLLKEVKEDIPTAKPDIFEIPKTKARQSSGPQSFLDDILGPTETEKTSLIVEKPKPQPKISTSSKIIDPLDILGPEPEKKIIKPKEVQKSVVAKPKPQSGPDWLGLLSQDKAEDIEEDGLPSWLGGGKQTKEKLINKRKSNISDNQTVKDDKIEAVAVAAETTVSATQGGPEAVVTVGPSFTDPARNVFTSNMDQSAAMCMQQQESQLMLALQLKAQEDRLKQLRSRQEETQKIEKEISNAHKSQLNVMLNQQVKYQQQMHGIIVQHQDNINEQIKKLLGHDPKSLEAEAIDVGIDPNIQPPRIQHLSIEQKLRQLIVYLQENHDKEMELMEMSYRRQMSLVDDSLKVIEERQKDEVDKIIHHYNNHLKHIEEIFEMRVGEYEEKIISLKAQHAGEIAAIQQQSERNLSILQKQHVDVVERIKETIAHERMVIQDSTGYSQSLEDILSTFKDHSRLASDLVRKIDERSSDLVTRKESDLKIREEQITEILTSLQRQRDRFEIEAQESKASQNLIKESLERQLQTCAEQARSLKTQEMELEFAKEHHKKHLALSTEQLQQENEKLLRAKVKLDEEKAKVDSEIEAAKTRMQMEELEIRREKSAVNDIKTKNENSSTKLEKMREELEDERRNLKSERLKLQQDVSDVTIRGRELRNLTRLAAAKQVEADQRISEADSAHRKYEDRIRRLQEQAISLNERENYISKEKTSMSRERLTLHNLKRELETKQCGLCRAQPSGDYDVTRDYIN